MRRWAKRIGLGLLALVAALTVSAAIYDGVSRGGVPAQTLYAGPYVQVDGRALAYRRWGSHGSPIVLIAGFIESSDVWRMVGPLLGRTHRVFALDLPPFGYSQRKGPYTLDAWLDEVEGFERALGIVRPTLVGHSLGAAVVVGEALRHPQAVHGIVLLDGDALRSGGAPSWIGALAVDPYFTAVYRVLTGWDWVFRRGLASAYGAYGPKLTSAELERWERPFRVAGTAACVRADAAARDPGLHARRPAPRAGRPRPRRLGRARHDGLGAGRPDDREGSPCAVRPPSARGAPLDARRPGRNVARAVKRIAG